MSEDATADGDATAPDGEWEAVFWDIGGVILALDSVQAAHADFIADVLERHEVDATVEEAIDTWRSTVGDYFRERDGTEFRSARDGYHRGVEAIVGEEIPRADWQPRFDEIVRTSIEPIPGAVETIERLAERTSTSASSATSTMRRVEKCSSASASANGSIRSPPPKKWGAPNPIRPCSRRRSRRPASTRNDR